MTNPRAAYHREYRAKNRAALIEKSREWHIANREKSAATNAAYRETHRVEQSVAALARYHADQPRQTEARRARRKVLRLQVITHYGGKCACCGEVHIEFLALDHINGGGNKQRVSLKIHGGSDFYAHIIKAGFPEGFRVLCHNCNMAHGLYGYCPHQQQPRVCG